MHWVANWNVDQKLMQASNTTMSSQGNLNISRRYQVQWEGWMLYLGGKGRIKLLSKDCLPFPWTHLRNWWVKIISIIYLKMDLWRILFYQYYFSQLDADFCNLAVDSEIYELRTDSNLISVIPNNSLQQWVVAKIMHVSVFCCMRKLNWSS